MVRFVNPQVLEAILAGPGSTNPTLSLTLTLICQTMIDYSRS